MSHMAVCQISKESHQGRLQTVQTVSESYAATHPVFAKGFVVAGCIVYVLAVVVLFIVVFLYCVCASFVCNVLLVCCSVVLLPLG
jgi:hypothetical protein